MVTDFVMVTDIDSGTAQPAILTDVEQTPPALIATKTNWRNLLTVLTLVIIIAIPVFAFALSIHQLKGGWDDGAITAAFSRTLATTGQFALTPLSEKVEGFSSVTWVFLLAVPYYIFHSTVATLVWMKLLSAVSFLLSLFIFRRLAGRLLGNAEQADIATILAAFLVGPLLETLNGMEMNLYMLLVLWLVDVLTDEKRQRHRAMWIWGLTFALIGTRFESPYLIVALLVGLLFSRDATAFWQTAAGSATGFGLMEIWRHHEFGVWMPNTVYAKMQLPYSPPHMPILMWWTRLSATGEIAAALGGPLLVLLFVAAGVQMWKHLPLPRAGKAQRGPVSVLLLGALLVIVWSALPHVAAEMLPQNELLVSVGFELLAIVLIIIAFVGRKMERLGTLTASLVAAGVAFGMLFGRNWGYDGRMILPCLPFLVLAIAYFFNRHIPSEHWRRTALVGCVLCQLLTWIPAVRKAWVDGYPVPISAIEHTGNDGEAVRRLSNLDSLSILTPDMGGSSVCCEKLQMLDSALLTNSYLAHNGYIAFDAYLHHQRPQVIETHGIWTALTRVYGSELMSDYSLAIVDQSRFLLRNDVYARIYSHLEATTGVHLGYGEQCLVAIDPGYPDLDVAFVQMRQSCLYISKDDLAHDGIPAASTVASVF